MILAIDPGNTESAYVVVDCNDRPVRFGKIPNHDLLSMVFDDSFGDCSKCAIEMVASYGMAVGREVFDTCVWIGRYTQAIQDKLIPVEYIYRKEEKMTLCGNMRARDANIRQALIDKFAEHDLKNGKGTKANPDWFYGFKADVWAAYAVAYTYKTKIKDGVNHE